MEQIQLGAILRIADAVELVANNYQRLLSDVAYYKKAYFGQRDVVSSMRRSISAYKGLLKRKKSI